MDILLFILYVYTSDQIFMFVFCIFDDARLLVIGTIILVITAWIKIKIWTNF